MSTHALWQAAGDLRLGPDASLVMLTEPPRRWDEYLDLRLPLLIASRVAPWPDLACELWEAGCPPELPLRLVEPSGRVVEVVWKEQRLEPAPESDDWVLAVGWSHPEEGWRTRLPLWGGRFVVTRSAEQGKALVARLRSLGAEAYAAPTIAFTDPDDLVPWVRGVEGMAGFDWILFTSPNGVDFFIERLCHSGLDLRALAQAKLACIGPSTAKTLAKYGLKADLVPKQYVAEGLLEALRQKLGERLAQSRFLLPRAQVARSVLPDGLAAAGAEVLVAPVYKTVPPHLGSLPEEEASLLFTSSSTVSNWLEVAPEHARSWPCYCIGPITAATARAAGIEVLGVADPYTVDGLVELIVEDRRRLIAVPTLTEGE